MNYFNQESTRLIYRRLQTSDIKDWEEFFVSNDRLQFLGLDATRNHHELAKEWIERQMQRYEENGLGLLGVIEKSTQTLIGMGGIIPREVDENKDFEIAYSLKPKAWRRGYGTEIAQQMKKFGLKKKLAEHFISIIAKDNSASIRVAEKNGMHILRETTFMGMSVFIYSTQSGK